MNRQRLSGSAVFRFGLIVGALSFVTASAAQAQTVTVYDDALQNGFQNYSYGGGSDFASTVQVHSGNDSISLLGNNFNALSFDQPGGPYSTAQYPTLRLWVRGGAANQHLQIILQNTVNNVQSIVANSALDTYLAGGAIISGQWVQATVNLTQAPLSYNGSFDRIDLQWNSSSAANAGEELYVDDVTLGQPSSQPASLMTIEHDVTVATMLSDRFTWQDASNHPRVAVLAHNDTAPEPNNGAHGGALRQFQYQLSNGATRTATVTTYGNGGYAGFGYVVEHSAAGHCVGDDSPLGGFVAGNWQRVFEGRHHAIFRFTQNYPRNCSTDASGSHTIPVTIDWVFSTGHDNPLYAINYDVDLTSPAAAVNTFYDDSRAPYGELNIDGEGFQDIDGTAWGDRYKFTSTSAPVTLDSTWTWNQTNIVPYVKEWIGAPLGPATTYNRDATMGIVQTQTMTQQDAAGARGPLVHDVTPFWTKTSADGNAGNGYRMPWQDDWPYQANADSIGVGISNNNARLTWRTQYGFVGQSAYHINDGVGETAETAPGYPKKSYSTYIVLGQHSALPVEAQVTQVEIVQSLTLTASTGSVVTIGPAGITRSDTVTYSPAGYNHVYGALAFSASGNALDANIAVGSGSLKNPLIIISNFTGVYPQVTLGGVTLVSDADYYPSLRTSASELWITLNRNLSGATNHLQILAPSGVPSAPTGVTAAAVTSTSVGITWNSVAGASSYQIDRKAAGGAFTQIGTPATNSFSDTTAVANAAYLYQIRAVNGSGPSANSLPDLATTVIFTDTTLTTGIAVKAVHLAQLRTAVNAVRSLANLSAAVFTDAATAGTPIKAVHVTELRTAVDAARSALSLSTGGYTDAPPLTGVIVKAVHFQELRVRVQ